MWMYGVCVGMCVCTQLYTDNVKRVSNDTEVEPDLRGCFPQVKNAYLYVECMVNFCHSALISISNDIKCIFQFTGFS